MALRSLSTASLRKEIARREKGAQKFIKKHATLSKAIAAIERTLADLGVGAMSLAGGTGKRRGRPPGSKNKRRGRPPGSKNKKPGRKPGRRGRAKNELSLHEALAKAVRVGSTVSPAQAMVAVKRIYKTTSRSFNVQVTNALSKSSAFKKTGRGAYLRKGGAAAPPAKRGPKPKMGRKTRKPSKRPGRKAARRSSKATRKAPASKPVISPAIVI